MPHQPTYCDCIFACCENHDEYQRLFGIRVGVKELMEAHAGGVKPHKCDMCYELAKLIGEAH